MELIHSVAVDNAIRLGGFSSRSTPDGLSHESSRYVIESERMDLVHRTVAQGRTVCLRSSRVVL